MENYRAILTAQKEALTKDIAIITEEINGFEVFLKERKDLKSLAIKELKAIEKKLAKL